MLKEQNTRRTERRKRPRRLALTLVQRKRPASCYSAAIRAFHNPFFGIQANKATVIWETARRRLQIRRALASAAMGQRQYVDSPPAICKSMGRHHRLGNNRHYSSCVFVA